MHITPPPHVTKMLFTACGTLIFGGFRLALALTPFGIA